MPSSNDLEGLRSLVMGIGLTHLPKLLKSLHDARRAGHNVDEGRAPDDHGQPAQEALQGSQDLQSALMPLVAHLMGQPGQTTSPEPPSGPGMRQGLRAPTVPPLMGMPRTQMASTGVGGL